jgi:hypothetical protein
MLLAIGVFLLQVAAVPQNSISIATTAETKTTEASTSGTVTESESSEDSLANPIPAPEATISEDLSQNSEAHLVPGVAFTPAYLLPKPVNPTSDPPISWSLPLSASRAFVPLVYLAPVKPRYELPSRRIWLALTIAEHGAATFDAWSTRRAVSSGQGYEQNPLFRPFARNASIYAAVQVGPALLDYLGRRMMRSQHGWVRHTWWLPQVLGTAMSIESAVHNLGVHSVAPDRLP